VIVIDLDDTVVSGSGWARGIASPFCPCPRPFPDAARVIRRLSETYQVVFLTARSAVFGRRTLGWLDAHDFPRAPLLCSLPCSFGSGPQRAYKSSVLRWLADQGPAVAWGIGDTPTDVRAYASVGARPILILEDERDADRRVPASACGRAPAPVLVVGHATAWAQIERHVLDADGRGTERP
jgi:hypothetical protein